MEYGVKGKWLFPAALAANLSMAAVCLLWRHGAPTVWPVLVALHIVLFVVNVWAGEKWWRVISLWVVHIVITICVHKQTYWMYSTYIASGADSGVVEWLGLNVGFGWTVFLFIVALGCFFALHNGTNRGKDESA